MRQPIYIYIRVKRVVLCLFDKEFLGHFILEAFHRPMVPFFLAFQPTQQPAQLCTFMGLPKI